MPPVREIKTFPEQKIMARKLYKDNADKFLESCESIDAPTGSAILQMTIRPLIYVLNIEVFIMFV